MARAYIVVARNDLPDNMLQILDLKPNSSQFSPAYDGQNGGQTGYATHYAVDAAVNTTTALTNGGGGNFTLNGVSYGLSAYLLDHVEQVGGAALSAAMANAARDAIFDKVAAGTALTEAQIDDALTNNGVANAAGGSGILTGNSTGTVEEVIRIVAGEVYRVPNAASIQAAGAFTQAVAGAFVTRPNIENPSSVNGTYGNVRGRSSTSPIPYLRPGEVRAGQAPVQTGTQDVLFRDVRVIVDAGDLHLSALSGALADLKSATYTFINHAFTYAGGATPAQTIGGVNIPATGIARGVVVYDASGNII